MQSMNRNASIAIVLQSSNIMGGKPTGVNIYGYGLGTVFMIMLDYA